MPHIEQAGRPSGSTCFGRDEFCGEVIRAAVDNGSVLLFGARQAGKSSVLLRSTEILKNVASTSSGDSTPIVPLYMNLQELPADAAPSDVLRQMASVAIKALLGESNATVTQSSGRYTVDNYLDDVSRAIAGGPRSDLKLLYLLDEAKRIVGDGFPRGFQDNLFALIYGEHALSGRCCFIFAGAQDLYKFCDDDTSPIGSRASIKLVRNLDLRAVSKIVEACEKTETTQLETVASRIFELTGGQAGLSVRLALSPEEIQGQNSVVLEALRRKHSSLLRGWAFRLSDEARAVQEFLLARGSLNASEIPLLLEKLGFDRYRGDQVLEEYEFTGIVIRVSDDVRLHNQIYAAFLSFHTQAKEGTDDQKAAWSKIEAAELALRQLVRRKYLERWPTEADAKIRSIFGVDSWETIMRNKTKAARSYRYTPHTPDGDVLHYAYFGQLTQLILANIAWDMFANLFRDKRELEDMARAVTPVRNDSAHFRSVPERELIRCSLICDDLMNLLAPALGRT